MGFQLTYRGYNGTYFDQPEPAEGILDAECDPEVFEDGCGFEGEVDATGDGVDWAWKCPTCGAERESTFDITYGPDDY